MGDLSRAWAQDHEMAKRMSTVGRAAGENGGAEAGDGGAADSDIG